MADKEIEEKSPEEIFFFDPEIYDALFKFLAEKYPLVYEYFPEPEPPFEKFWDQLAEEEAFMSAACHFLYDYTMSNSETVKEYLAIPLDMQPDEIREIKEEEMGDYWVELLSWKGRIFQGSGPNLGRISLHLNPEEAWAEVTEQIKDEYYLVPVETFKACLRGEKPWSHAFPPEKQKAKL